MVSQSSARCKSPSDSDLHNMSEAWLENLDPMMREEPNYYPGPPSTLNAGYGTPNSGYLGPNRGQEEALGCGLG